LKHPIERETQGVHVAKLSLEDWKTLRSQYESGRYKSLETFHDEYIQTKHGQKGPTLKTVRLRAAAEKWSKRALEPQIQANCERITVEMYARLGLPPEEAAKAVVIAVRDVTDAREKLIATMTELAKADGAVLDLDKLQQVIEYGRAYIADKRAAAPYLVEYHKVTGAHAPAKHEHSGKVSVSNDFAGMSATELIADAKQRIARVEGLLAKGPAPWQNQKQQ